MDKISSSGGQATTPPVNVIQRGVESAGVALHQGIDKLVEPARSTVESLSATAHQSVDSLAGSAGKVANRFADETRKIAEAPGKALDYSKNTIQGRPLEAVGLALALGFILGRLTAR